MTQQEVVIVQTGVANTASVVAAFERLVCKTVISQDAALIQQAKYVVLPGVGTFGATMETLIRYRLVNVLQNRISNQQKTLAICVGFQVLFEGSEESPGIRGLEIFEGNVRKFTGSVRVPQLGWNWVQGALGTSLGNGYAYFANSYCVTDSPDNVVTAWSEHGINFVAGLQHKGLVACQFHPELSGEFGKNVLCSWLYRTEK